MSRKSRINIALKEFNTHAFGYTSHSIPGIEIIGLGTRGRQLKEKFVYILKELSISLPLRKFTLCVELSDEQYKRAKKEIENIELPLFLMLLSLAELLPINKLDNCWCLGRLCVDGMIELNIDKDILQDRIGSRDFIISTSSSKQEIPLSRLIKHLPLKVTSLPF